MSLVLGERGRLCAPPARAAPLRLTRLSSTLFVLTNSVSALPRCRKAALRAGSKQVRWSSDAPMIFFCRLLSTPASAAAVVPLRALRLFGRLGLGLLRGSWWSSVLLRSPATGAILGGSYPWRWFSVPPSTANEGPTNALSQIAVRWQYFRAGVTRCKVARTNTKEAP